MTESAYGWKFDRGDGASGRASAVDQRLTWLRPFAIPPSQGPWQLLLASLEQDLVDFHARYERACIED
jgi:hypothetical protein